MRTRRTWLILLAAACLIFGFAVFCLRGWIPASAATSPTRPGSASARRTPRVASPTPSGAAASTESRFRTAAAAVLPADMGDVEVRDLTAGITLTYGERRPVETASIVKVGILATLYLQCQDAGRDLTGDEEDLATGMIEDSNNDDAQELWEQIGGADAYLAAMDRLGLTATTPDDSAWGLTTTTASDQNRLLSQLLAVDSPITAEHRAAILALMDHVDPDQRWGASALGAAAEKTGLLPLGDDGDSDYVVNSIGIVTVDNHTLLVSVLSRGWDSESAGASALDQVAIAARQALLGR